MTAIIDRDGRLLMRINGDADVIRLNTPAGGRAVEEPADDNMYYNGDTWVRIPPAPADGYVFEYKTRVWIYARSLSEAKSEKWKTLKNQRDALEFGGFEFEGGIYDSDQVSQGRIMGAANAGQPQTWTLANNTTVDLTAEELKELCAALQKHVSNAHERGRAAKALLDEATTIEQIKAVTL